MNAYDIIRRPVLSEKSYDGIPSKNYTFEVAAGATKTEVKLAIEAIFHVSVARVNVANVDGKLKRMGKHSGFTPAYKKAYVKLTDDSKAIEFFESLS